MKYAHYIGFIAGMVLIAACFLPWAYYPDIDKIFTGFFSEQNRYGKPGILLCVLSVMGMVLFIIPKIWAKRLNIAITALTIAFSARSFMLFSSCYRGICPDKRIGLLLILIAPIIMVVAAVLPDIKLKNTEK